MKFLLVKIVMIFFLVSLIVGVPTVVIGKSKRKFAERSKSKQGTDGCMKIWSGILKDGPTYNICKKSINLDTLKTGHKWDLDISSIEVSPNTYVQICTGQDLKGDCIQYIGPIYIPDMRSFYWAGQHKDFNDKVRSVLVSALPMGAGCWELYEHINYAGKKLAGCASKENLIKYGFNDKASSYKLAAACRGKKIALYLDINYGKKVDENEFDSEKHVPYAAKNKQISSVGIGHQATS